MAGQDTSRPRAQLGKVLRQTLHCPMTHSGMESMLGMESPNREPLKVIAYRQKSIRLECPECGLRFSIDPTNLADTMARLVAPPPEAIQGQAMQMANGDPQQYRAVLARLQARVRELSEIERRKVLDPHEQAIARAKPRKGKIRFPKR